MDIQRLENKEQAAAVWHTCFHDSMEFIHVYFEEAANWSQTLGYFEKDRLLADMFMLDFTACLSGAYYDTAFIAGCATLPEARKRGLMRTLIKNALVQLHNRDICVTYLHPFLHSFYRKFDFETISYVTRSEMKVDRNKMNVQVRIVSTVDDIPIERLENAYKKYVSRFDNYFIRNGKRFRTWLDLLFVDNGRIAYIERENEIAAYMLYYVQGDIAEIFELVCFNADDLESLFHSVPVKTCKYFLPGKLQEHNEEFTMMRVVDPIKAIKTYPFQTAGDFVLSIEDPFMQHDYRFAVEINRNRKVSVVERIDAKSDFQMGIGTFATVIAGAYDVKAWKDIKEFFPEKSSCFFETY